MNRDHLHTDRRADRSNDEVAAIVLCGGRSQRMGTDKAWLTLNGESFFRILCDALTPRCRPTIAVAADGQRLPPVTDDVMVVRDEFPDAGPLNGFLTGLEAVSRVTHNRCLPVLLCAVDAPCFSIGVVDTLIKELGEGQAVVLNDVSHGEPVSISHLNPLPGVYRSDVLPTVRRIFDAGQRRLGAVLRELDTRFIDPDRLKHVDPTLMSLVSVNTPEDYAKLKLQGGPC